MKALLEIYLEDLPPSEFPDLLNQMEDKLSKMLKSERLDFEEIDVGMTVRRLYCIVKGLPERQPDSIKVVKGPPKNIAFKDGEPTKALEGFLRKNSASIEDITLEDGYVFLKKKVEGKSTKEVLKDVFKRFIESLEFKKPMRWGKGRYEFVRPVHSILALLDDEIVEFDVFGLRSGDETFGLRFHSGKVKIENVDSYEKKLEENFVIVDMGKRKKSILDQLESLDLDVDEDEELVEEVVHLTEYPKAVVGQFDPSYLDLPPEIIMTTVKHHERTFATFKDGEITNTFVGFQDGPGDPKGNVKRGFERVINARLEDARYYYEKDLKTPFEKWLEDLKGMVFQKRLGTLYDKVVRIMEISKRLANEIGFTDLKKVERTALLSKVDIASKVVYEFPELQGVMGRIYAQKRGEDEDVAWAIQEQYSSDPDNVLGAIVGISDRIDTLVGNFAIGNVPKGSKDPYGLRRKLDDIFSIIRKFEWDLDLKDLYEFSKDLLKLEFDTSELESFSGSRFRAFLISRGIAQDVAKAVEHLWLKPLRGVLSAEALNELVETEDVKALRVGFERVHNMTKNFESREYDGALFEEEAEIELMNAFMEVKEKVLKAIERLNYKEALNHLIKLKPHIDRYFDEVFVMVNREDIRRNRLGFLKNVDDLFMEVADLTMISKERVLEGD